MSIENAMQRAFLLQRLYTPAALDIMATMGRSAVAEPVAGATGLIAGATASPEDRLNTATQTIEEARQFLGREPSTALGALAMQKLGDSLAPIYESAEQAGDVVFEKTGSPLLATIAKISPDIIGAAVGGGATTKAIPKSVSKDFAAITPEGSSFGDMLRVIEGKSFPKKVSESTKVDAYNPDKAGTNVAVIPKKKGTPGLTLEGQEIRRLNNEIARTRKKIKDAEKANNQQLVTENTQLELQLTNQKKNYLAELGKQYEGKVYFWEGDKFLDMQSGQDIGESIVDGVNIGVDRSGMIVDKKAPAKVFMTVGEGITEPGSTRLTGFKKTNKENSVIATNLRVRSHFEWTDIKGKPIKPPQGMEDQKIVSVAVGDKHYYTIDLKQQGPTYLLKEGVDAKKLQKGSIKGAAGSGTDNPHLKTVQVGDIYLNNSKNNILGYAITKTAKNKVAHPVYKQIHTVGNQMPDVN